MKKKSPEIFAQRFLLCLGLLFLVIGIGLGAIQRSINQDWRQKGVRTEATIIEVAKKENAAYIRYSVHGEEYQSRLDYYSSTMHVGDSVEIFYDSSYPANFYTPQILLILLLVGSIFGVVGTALVIVSRVWRKKTRESEIRRERLLSSGVSLEAKITSIALDRHVMVNGRNPFVLDCEYTAPGGSVSRFRSDRFWDTSLLREGGIIRVWVNGNDYSEYWVDTDSVGA